MMKITLPSPRSPKELDDKILAYAKARAPDKKRHGIPLWLSGIATASVVVVAVIVALPPSVNQTPNIEISTAPEEVSASSLGAVADSIAPSLSKRKMEMSAVEAADMEQTTLQRITPDKSRDFYELELIRSLAATAPLNESTLREEIEILVALRASGESEQAEAEYKHLKETCTNCELPETLDLAIEKYGEEK